MGNYATCRCLADEWRLTLTNSITGHKALNWWAPRISSMKQEEKEKAMTISIRDKLATLGLELPAPTSPAANYISVVRTGNLLFISGQISKAPDGEIIAGTLGADISHEQGVQAALIAALNGAARLSRAMRSKGSSRARPGSRCTAPTASTSCRCAASLSGSFRCTGRRPARARSSSRCRSKGSIARGC